jgi:hypothetical protein
MGGIRRLGGLEGATSSYKVPIKEKLSRAFRRIPQFFTNRSTKWKAVFIAFVFIASFLTIFLAGNVPAQNIKVVNGQSYLSQIYAETPNASVGFKNNFTNWTVGVAIPNTTTENAVESPNGIVLSGTFPESTKASSVTIQDNMFANLTQYPLIYARVNVTSGVKYGIRLFSTASNGTIFPIWSDTDGLNHRPGMGVFENIQTNVPLLAIANSKPSVTNITRIQFYVERSPETTPTNFTMTIQSLKFLNYNLVSFQSGQTYHAIYFTFKSLPNVNTSQWVLNKIDLGMSLAGSPGTTYTVLQFNGTRAISGYNYQYSQAVSTYDYSLYPRNPSRPFSDTVPPDPSNTNVNFSIVVVALSGTLSNVTLNSLTFVYTPPVAAPPPTAPGWGEYWYAYLVVFIFLLPLTVALLLYEEFRKDNFKPIYIVVALIVGLVCRLALAPIGSQPFDLSVYATSARGWFDFANTSTSLGPTLPFTFFLYWLPYSFYALLLKGGFHDFFFLNQQIGFFEMIFLKAFPIIADVAIFFLFQRFKKADDGYSGSTSNFGKIFAIFYFLNPLSIYISSVWGQYEASTIALVVLGFLYLYRQSDVDHGDEFGYLKASLAFVVSALIEIVGLIPLAFLFIKSIFSKPFNFKRPLLLLAPLALIFVYSPEFHLIYLIYLSAVGISSPLLQSQPHTPYTIISNFPQLLPYHPLLLALGTILSIFLIRRNYSLNSIITYTLLSFIAFVIFAAQEPQWWVMILALSLLCAMLSGKYSLGIYMLSFGALVAFLIFTYTQGSGYILFATPKDNIVPLLENLYHGINIYTVGTTIGALLAIGYVIFSPRESIGARTVFRSSLILFGVFILSVFWFSIMRVPL